MSHSSLIAITNPILNKEEHKFEKTVRLEEVGNFNFTIPKSIIQLSKAKIMKENNKLK